MLLTIDIGNAKSHVGVFDGAELAASWMVTTNDSFTTDEAYIATRNLLASMPQVPNVEAAIIASVVPQVTESWAEACRRLTGARAFIVGPGLKTGIKMHYNDPAEIGADRIADFVAAKAAYPAPFVIVDFGTATNIEVSDREGSFIGGIIAPGLDASARTLADSAAQLFRVNLQMPASVVGKNTRTAIQSGILRGEIARIDGLVQMIWDELGYQTEVVATGGLGEFLWNQTKTIGHYDADLTLKGLQKLYELNRRN